MSYTLIISGDKPYAGVEGLDDLRDEVRAQRATEDQAAHRDAELNEVRAAISDLRGRLSGSGHTVREVILDGEKVEG